MAKPRKIKSTSSSLASIIDIGAMQAEAKRAVQSYRLIVSEINRLIDNHPEVNQSFLIDTVLEQFGVDEHWFNTMQEHHKQSIIDSVRGRHD